jgi:ketosteroid isomerase-like protein
MTTEELMTKLIAYVHEGKNVQAEEELYADDVLSVEQDGRSAQGKEAVIAKTKGAAAYVEEFYSVKIDPAFVGAESFLLVYKMDIKPKGGERIQMTEYGFYKVKDGLVLEEYFFAKPYGM